MRKKDDVVRQLYEAMMKREEAAMAGDDLETGDEDTAKLETMLASMLARKSGGKGKKSGGAAAEKGDGKEDDKDFWGTKGL